MGRCVRGGNGGRAAGSRNEREAEGCGQKVENRAAGARFQARCWKWGWRAMGEGGEMVYMTLQVTQSALLLEVTYSHYGYF